MTVATPRPVPAAVRRLEGLLVGRVRSAGVDPFGAPPQRLRPRAVGATLADHLLTHRQELQHWLAGLDPTIDGTAWSVAPQRFLTGRLRGWLEVRNQFLTFDEATATAVEAVYLQAGHDLAQTLADGDRDALEAVFERHHARLGTVLTDRLGPDLHAAPGAQYSPTTQLAVLGLAPGHPGARVLDLGTGPEAPLVHHLRTHGLDAHGIDKSHGDDWLTYDFGHRRWDLVLSHLGFSLHFLRHEQQRADTAYDYARTYMKILAGLRSGGVFAYAPALPFFEALLGSDFAVQRLPWPAGRPPGVLDRQDTPHALSAYRATQITRLD